MFIGFIFMRSHAVLMIQPDASLSGIGLFLLKRKALKAARPFVPGAGVNCYRVTVKMLNVKRGSEYHSTRFGCRLEKQSSPSFPPDSGAWYC